MNNYSNEVRECYGNTEAYREYSHKAKNYSKEKWCEINEGLIAIFAEFATCKGNGVDSDSYEAQGLVGKLQNYINNNYYTCTNEILASLGKMYVCDERFKANIDKHGEGTALFASEAIDIFCKREYNV